MRAHCTEPTDECGAFALPPGHDLCDQNGQRRTAAAPVHTRSGGITMSTFFVGEGNIGSAPEFQEFPSGNDEPRRLLRLNVYFDNPVPTKDGYEDRGGYWAPVELWHRDAERWAALDQQGRRVLVHGTTGHDDRDD